ncbi:MAG: Trm112 family protein [Anaerolineales bacterium]
MVSKELIEILRCPHCVQQGAGELEFYKEAWFTCKECGRKYPVIDDIPVMLIEVGEKFINTPVEQLEVPPPKSAAD